MSQFYQTFFEESFEGLENMDAALRNMDVRHADADTMHAIYRTIHAIKGGSATFGFEDMAAFAHVLETLLDDLREGLRTVTVEIVQLLRESADCLREMLIAAREGRTASGERSAHVQARLETVIHGESTVPEERHQPGLQSFDSDESDELEAAAAMTLDEPPTEAVDDMPSAPLVDDEPDATSAVDEAPPIIDEPLKEAEDQAWRIGLTPGSESFRIGHDPLQLFRDLALLGDTKVTVRDDTLPVFADMDPEASYLSWDFELRGGMSREAIESLLLASGVDCDVEVEPLGPPPPQEVDESPMLPLGADEAGDAGLSVRVSVEKIDSLVKLVDELVAAESVLNDLGDGVDPIAALGSLGRLRSGLAQIEHQTRRLQESVMDMRMLPVGLLYGRLARMLETLGAEQDKRIEMETTGEKIELDQSLLNALEQPVRQVVRDLVAGLEQHHGVLRLAASQETGCVTLEIGLDNTMASAGQEGLKALEQALLPVGGQVERRGMDTLVRVPPQPEAVHGQLVRLGAQRLLIPSAAVAEALPFRRECLSAVAGRAEVYRVGENHLPLVRLQRRLAIPGEHDGDDGGAVVVIKDSRGKLALLVDDVLGARTGVLKRLETNFRPVTGFVGAVVLGDARVVLILDVACLFDAGGSGASRGRTP